MTRKFTFLLMALLALAGFKSWGQETLTVYENGTANGEIPLNTGWIDTQGTISQCIIPASELGAMTGGTISQMQFYIYQAGQYGSIQNAVLECSLGEVATTTITSAITTGLTTVWSGNLNFSETNLTVTFTTPYQYNGGNLVISFNVVTSSSYTNYTFWGITTNYNSCYSSQYIETNKFLPKTTFTYTGGSSCIAPTGLAASNITTTGATISWTGNDAESYDFAYGVASTFDLSNPSTYAVQNTTTTSVQLSGLTAETEYKCAVRSHCNAEEVSAWSSAVSFLPTAKMTLTVNEGNNYNEFVPFYGYYADNLTKSQFIIPATTLSAMEGADITAMEFYTTTSGSNNGPANYTFGGSWDVYFKIVDHVEMPSSYEPLEGMDKVYTGNMVIANNKMTLTFAEPYTYEGGNLMICFNQTASTDYKHTYWKGVTTGPTAAYAGYGSNNYNHGNYYFLPTTTFTYTPGATRYNVEVPGPMLEGSVSADPTSATAGTLINLTATPTYECVCGFWNVYEFGGWIEYYDDVEIVNNQFTMPGHDVEIFVTFNPVSTYGINVNTFDEVTIRATFDGWDIVNAPAETIVTLSADLDEGYIFDYFTVDGIQISGNTFEMPDHAVTISAVFHEPVTYTITLHQNGAVSTVDALEGNLLYEYLPAYVDVPCVMNVGWIANDIETYTIVEPELIDTYNTVVGSNLDLYAVFSYSEDVPVAKSVAGYWSKVTDPATLKNGDKVVFVYNDSNNSIIMCDRSGSLYDGRFNPGSVTVSDDVITTIPDNAVEFTLQSDGDNWKLRYVDALEDGETTLAYNNFDLYPKNYAYGTSFSDIWTAEINSNSVFFRETTCTSARYIAYNNGYFKGNASDIACHVYKAGLPYVTNTYYMTSVLTEGEEVEDYVAKNIILDQYHQLFVTGTLELDANGLFRNTASVNDNFTFEDGAQFIYRGTEPINARFFKEIEAYSDAEGRDGYYLVANPTNNSDMSGWTFTLNKFDLYTFEGDQELEWINQHSNINFNRGTGYLFACEVETTLPFIGELLPAGSMNVALDFYTGTESGRDFPGFNLIGNPFACNAYVNGYNFYRMVDGELQTAVTSATIAPCEGFFVEATAANQSVTISTTAPEASASLLNITVNQNRGNVIDRAIVNFNGNNDLHKFMMNPAHTNLSIAKGGETFAAISTEAEGELPVNFKAEKDGTYTITVNTENVEANYLHLIDNLTGMDTDLLSTPSYTFNATTSDYASRFKLVFSMNNNEDMSQANSFAYINNGEIIISNEGRATLQVIDVMGRIISSEEIHGECRISTNGMTAGLYILNLNGMTQKIVVR